MVRDDTIVQALRLTAAEMSNALLGHGEVYCRPSFELSPDASKLAEERIGLIVARGALLSTVTELHYRETFSDEDRETLQEPFYAPPYFCVLTTKQACCD